MAARYIAQSVNTVRCVVQDNQTEVVITGRNAYINPETATTDLRTVVVPPDGFTADVTCGVTRDYDAANGTASLERSGPSKLRIVFAPSSM